MISMTVENITQSSGLISFSVQSNSNPLQTPLVTVGNATLGGDLRLNFTLSNPPFPSRLYVLEFAQRSGVFRLVYGIGDANVVAKSYNSTGLSVDVNFIVSTCSGNCGFGDCTENGTCRCNDGYQGANCNTYYCEACLEEYGSCNGPNLCVCNEGHFGLDCKDIEPVKSCSSAPEPPTTTSTGIINPTTSTTGQGILHKITNLI